MTEEDFSCGNTLFHKRDARVKIIAAVTLSLVLALNSSISAAFAGLLVGATMLAFSKPTVSILIKRMGLVNIFTLFLWFTLPLTYQGDSFTGVQITTLITLKTNAIFCCFLALIATSSAVSLGHGLGQLGLPAKFTFLLLFSYRQLFIIRKEYSRLQRAAQLRGFIPKNTLHTYKTYSHLFGMTLVKSWNRADCIHQAMILRGFKGKLIPLARTTLCTADYIFLALLLLISLLLTLFSYYSKFL